MNESDFTRKIRKDLESSGWFTEKISQRFSSGFPDFIAIKDGRVFFIEVKEFRSKLTKLQEHKLKKIHSMGGNVRVLWFSKIAKEYIYCKLQKNSEGEVVWNRCEDLLEYKKGEPIG